MYNIHIYIYVHMHMSAFPTHGYIRLFDLTFDLFELQASTFQRRKEREAGAFFVCFFLSIHWGNGDTLGMVA